MEISGDNAFKAKSYAAAAFNIERLDVQLSEIDPAQISSIKGIGESTAKKVIELLQTNEIVALKELIQKIPAGVIEMLNIKGIGPKKISVIWKEMNIESIGELLYACKENRLKLFKGFGEKTQKNIEDSIEFYLQHRGTFLFSQADAVFPQVKQYLEKIFFPAQIGVTGAFRRQLLTIDAIEFVVVSSVDTIKQKMITANPPEIIEENAESITFKLMNGLKLKFYSTTKETFHQKLFYTSASEAFIQSFEEKYNNLHFNIEGNDDAAIFEQVGIQYIPAFARENESSIILAAKSTLPNVIQATDIRGIIHSHSNWSDGSNTIAEMANAAIAKGLEYLVISDHSKSAFYANGLSEERIIQQHVQIDELNQKLAPFKIFKSIECDILFDGKLDYTDDILKRFDLVIASVHSILNMTEEKAMQRLLAAVQNPYTTILGHPTGRLLLSRKGYPINHAVLIDACAKNDVILEINANPNRLDLDWEYIEAAQQKGVLLSINPDAHEIAGFDDVKYGVLAAQKGLLTKQNNFSSWSLTQVETYLANRKKAKGL